MNTSADNIINLNEYRISALMRSGQHAVINWMVGGCKGNIYLLNNCHPNRNIFLKVKPDSYKFKENRIGDLDLEGEARGVFAPKDNLIYNYESHYLHILADSSNERDHDRCIGRSQKRYDVLILRDAFNWLASSLQNKEIRRIQEKTLVHGSELWKEHAREFLGKTHFLKHNRVCINYNTWFESEQERSQLAQNLGLNVGVSIEKVLPIGTGSSFDKTTYDNNAQSMKVLERWKAFVGNSTYLGLIDEEMVRLSEQIFGHIPGTEVLFPRKGLVRTYHRLSVGAARIKLRVSGRSSSGGTSLRKSAKKRQGS